MQINYRILSADESECSIVVRYWTDLLSEKDLSIDPKEPNDVPLRCRTDYNLNIWDASLSEDQIHDFILSNAPIAWFELKHTAKTAPVPALKSLVGVSRSTPVKAKKEVPAPPVPWSDKNEVDITHLLSAGS